MGIVTISASYGTGGSQIGPAVSAALELPFVDRAIPTAVAKDLGVPVTDAEAQDDRSHTGFWRLLSSLALVPDLSGGGQLGYSSVSDERVFKERTEQVLLEVAEGPGGVILGRAAAVVIGDRPDALHVRLDGPAAARVAQVAAHEGVSTEQAARLVGENDRAREAYVRNFYQVDATSCALYHLVVDATAFTSEQIVALLVGAARARGIGTGGRKR